MRLMFCIAIVAASTVLVSAADSDSGLHLANAIVDTQTVAAHAPSSPSTSHAATAVSAPLFADMALLSSRPVMRNALGIVIRNQEHRRVSVRIHDSQGRPVMSRRYSDAPGLVSIKTDQFIAGVYVYTISIGDSIFTAPFIVHR
jgi:hypothetical protein